MSCLSCAIFIRNVNNYRINSFANIMTGRVIAIDDTYIYVKSQRTTFIIENEHLGLELIVGSEVQFQTDKKRAPILVKKCCVYKRYYIAHLLT